MGGFALPFWPAFKQFYPRGFLAPRDFALTSTVPLYCHFLMTFRTVEIAGWKCFDIFLHSSPALCASLILFSDLQPAA